MSKKAAKDAIKKITKREGKSESEIKAELEEEFSAFTVEEHLKDLINKGMDKKEAIKTVAKMRNIPKKEVYKIAIDL